MPKKLCNQALDHHLCRQKFQAQLDTDRKFIQAVIAHDDDMVPQLKKMMETMGQAKTHLQLKRMIQQVDTTKSGTITYRSAQASGSAGLHHLVRHNHVQVRLFHSCLLCQAAFTLFMVANELLIQPFSARQLGPSISPVFENSFPSISLISRLNCLSGKN